MSLSRILELQEHQPGRLDANNATDYVGKVPKVEVIHPKQSLAMARFRLLHQLVSWYQSKPLRSWR